MTNAEDHDNAPRDGPPVGSGPIDGDHRARTLIEQIPIPSKPAQFAHTRFAGPFRLREGFRCEMVESAPVEVPPKRIAEISPFSARRGSGSHQA